MRNSRMILLKVIEAQSISALGALSVNDTRRHRGGANYKFTLKWLTYTISNLYPRPGSTKQSSK